MTIAKFIWEKLRLVNRFPGTYFLYEWLVKIAIRDGKTVLLKRGPAAGYYWKHYHCHQAWMAMGLYEPHVARLIYDTLKPGDTFYDVGANAGYFSLIAAKAVGLTGRVVAFDPIPINVHVIKEQIEINKLSNRCVIEPLAISNTNGVLSFTISKRNANSHLSNIPLPHVIMEEEREVIQVETTTLDDYVQKHSHPTLIKMDIEGAEVNALEGAKTLLSSKNTTFLISVHSLSIEKQVKAILKKNGYEFFNLHGFEQMIFAGFTR